MLSVVVLLLVVGGTILAYPCAFQRGVFREVFYLAYVLSKKMCSERGVFKEVCSERCVKPERTSKFVSSGEYLPTK